MKEDGNTRGSRRYIALDIHKKYCVRAGVDHSGTKLVQKGITKEGRKEPGWAVVEVAQRAVKSDPLWKHRCQEMHRRMRRNQAMVAIARRLMVKWSKF